MEMIAALLEPEAGTGTYWTIICILGGVVASQAAYIVSMWKAHAKALAALYDARILDLKGHNDLVETLLEKTDKKK